MATPTPSTRFAVILPAAGRSVRYGGPRNKLFESLRGRAVVAWAAAAFLARADVAEVIFPTRDEASLRDALGDIAADGRIVFTAGGDCRAASVRVGVERAGDVPFIAVHDAARPLVTNDVIDRTLQAAVQHGAAAPAMGVSLTIKQAAGQLPSPVTRTVPRHDLWAMQTPQIVRRDWLLDAFARCPLPLDEVTDDLQLVELAGHKVWLVQGDERNLKITTPMDLKLADLLMDDRVAATP